MIGSALPGLGNPMRHLQPPSRRHLAAAFVFIGLIAALATPLWHSRKRTRPALRPAPERPIHRPVPVAAAHADDVPEGFRGAVHPLLRGATHLEVKSNV